MFVQVMDIYLFPTQQQINYISNYPIYLAIKQCTSTELQIRGGIEDNSEIIFIFLNKNICCDPSLEPSK